MSTESVSSRLSNLKLSPSRAYPSHSAFVAIPFGHFTLSFIKERQMKLSVARLEFANNRRTKKVELLSCIFGETILRISITPHIEMYTRLFILFSFFF